MSNNKLIKLILEQYVRPETEVDKVKQNYTLGPSDVSMLLLKYPTFLYLFKKPQSFNPSSFLEKLKLSLSQALVHFYPLAGQLVTHTYKDDENSCSIFIDCHKGSGARLIQAEALEVSLADVLPPMSDDIPPIVGSLFDADVRDLINYDGHTKPLLSVQVTELADGVVLGICINHVVADASTSFHFYRIWSELFMGASLRSTTMPVVDGDRPSVKLPCSGLDEFIITRPYNHQSCIRERIFYFSPQSIALLKDKAITSENKYNLSSFQVLSAFVWRCITRARNLHPSEKTVCGLVTNLRQRFDPPLPQEYFGNYLMKASGVAYAGELLTNSLGSAASLLHHAVISVNETAKAREKRHEPQTLVLPGLGSVGPNPVLMMGSARLDAYGAEFGLGKAVVVQFGFQGKVGVVVASPGTSGHGWVDLHICLPPHTMSLLLSDLEFMSFASNSSSSKL